MSKHTRTRRPMRDDERGRATKLAEANQRSRLVLGLKFFAGTLVFGLLLGWFAARFDPEALLIGRVVGWGLGAGLWAIIAWHYRAAAAVTRARLVIDADRGEVEELEVETDEVIQLETHHDAVTPAFAIAIGEGKLLLLAGPTLLPLPDSFPSRSFVVTRLPDSGEIFGIRVTGEELAPARTAGVDLRMYNPLPSEIVPGTTARVTEAFPPR